MIYCPLEMTVVEIGTTDGANVEFKTLDCSGDCFENKCFALSFGCVPETCLECFSNIRLPTIA